MDSDLHFPNNVGTLQTVAGSNSVHPGLPDVTDHQPGVYQPFSDFQPDAPVITLPHSTDANAPTTATVADSKDWATKDDWTKYQPVIRQLYLQDKKSLKKVMSLMESKYGFRATVKMYKTHIQQWGLDKKNKEPEMRAIVRKSKQRQDQGKKSTIRIRGQLRNFAEVLHYWERKGVSIDDIIARQTASPTPEAVKLLTPAPSPIPTPQMLDIPERILRSMRDYFKGSFESRTWVGTEPTLGCHSIRDKYGADWSLYDLNFDCRTACLLFSRNLFDEAGQTIIAATAKIDRILLAESPHTIHMLLSLISELHMVKRNEVALIVLRQFSALGELLLGNEHPLCRISQWLATVHESDREEMSIRCTQNMVDLFESSLGAMHRSTLAMRTLLFSNRAYTAEARIQMMQNLLDECEKVLQPDDSRTFMIRYTTADEFYLQGCYDEAVTLVRKNIAYAQSLLSTNTGFRNYSLDLYLLAICQHALGEVDSGITTLHEAIGLEISLWGSQRSRVRSWLLVMEDWYSEQGLWESAGRTRERRLEILGRSLVD